jgi:DNA polymerase III delta prime subunit
MDFVDVVDVVSAALRQLKTEPYGESYIIRKAIIKVEASIEDLVRIKNFLVYDHDELKEMLEKLVALVYKIEDFAETQFLRRMHARSMGFGGRYIFILRQMLNLKAKVDFRSEMRKIELEVDGVIKESGVIKERHPREQSDVVGFEEDKRQLVGWLTDTNSSPNLGFLLISGQTGSGKTTFATEIYKSPELKRHFKFRAWVSASEDPVSNLRSILQQLDGDSTVYMKSNEAELKEKICETLQKKRCLLVVDNNMTNPYELFEIIPDSALSDEGNGSRVIMTIFRKTFLIDYFMYEYRSSLRYELKPLQEEDAWQLFLKKVRFPDNVQSNQSPDLDYNKLKSKIIAISRGIPSAIVLLGRFLSTKKSYKECLAVLDRNPIEGNELVSVSKMLALMNSDLTSRLRPCLLYFGLFPKGCEIPVRRLLRLWLAEGLIENDDPNPEDNPAWINLKMKGMIEIAKRRKDGSPKTCRLMPGILHDICLSKAQDIFGLLHIHPTTPVP